ncbi:hypothetical protein [Catenulispora rubra]|uniref:hypothetical protein n=1 Tax=Catenulispora rubra TaxID=280293 RepID=UPI001892756F|nr:hypothetical protein [Catenulispora rubra]
MASTSNPLKVVKNTFDLLCQGPLPLSLTIPADAGSQVAGKRMDLSEITGLLDDSNTETATRNAIWAQLVRESRGEDSSWVVVACALAYPALRSKARTLSRCFPGDPADIAAEVLEGFLIALRTVDLSDPAIGSVIGVLVWKAFNLARRERYREVGQIPALDSVAESQSSMYPTGHPDIILARAVRAGVITGEEADYIGRTRLEGQSFDAVTAEFGIARATLWRYREAAEARLVSALQTGAI